MSLPLGCRFAPTDVQLLHYLNKKVNKEPLPLVDAIVEANVYSTEPYNLVKNKDSAYFFSLRTRQHKNSTYKSRRAASGTWHSEKKCPITDKGKVVGYKTRFSFRSVAKKSTGWVMHEYELLTYSHQDEEQVLCLIKRRAHAKSSCRCCRERIHGEVSTNEGFHMQMQTPPTQTSSAAELAPVPPTSTILALMDAQMDTNLNLGLYSLPQEQLEPAPATVPQHNFNTQSSCSLLSFRDPIGDLEWSSLLTERSEPAPAMSDISTGANTQGLFSLPEEQSKQLFSSMIGGGSGSS